MPRIREYGVNTGVPSAVQNTRIAAVDTTSGLRTAGQEIRRAGAVIQDAMEDRDENNALYLASEANNSWAKRFQEMQKEAAPDGGDFTANFEKEYDSWREEALKNVSTARGERVLSRSLDGIKSSYLKQSIDFQSDRFGKYQVAREKQTTADDINTVRSNPSLREDTLKLAQERIKANPYFIQAGIADSYAQEVSTQLHDAALRGYVDTFQKNKNVSVKQVQKALGELGDKEGSPWVTGTSPGAYSEAKNQLEGMERTLTQRDQEVILSDFKSEMNRIRVTGVSNGKYTPEVIQASGASDHQKQLMLREYNESRAVGDAVLEVKGQSDEEILKDLSKREAALPQAQDFDSAHQAYQAKLQAFNQRTREWTSDPMQSIVNESSLVQTRYQELLSKENPTTDDYEKYGDVALAEQSRLHPGQNQSLLTNAQASLIQNALDQVNTKADGPKAAVDLIKQEQEKWGKHWPTVLTDMRKRLKLSDEAFVVTNLVSVPGSERVSEELLKSSQKYGKDAALKDVEKSERDQFFREAQGELASLRESLAGYQNSDEVYSSYRDAIASLATYRAYTGSGKSTNVSDIANEVLNDHYHFRGSYMIPRAEPVDPDTVDNNAGAVVDQIYNGQRKVTVPKSTTGLTDEQAKKLYLNSLRSSSRWVGTKGGIRLIDANGADVLDASSGMPVGFTFQELNSMTLPPQGTSPYIWPAGVKK